MCSSSGGQNCIIQPLVSWYQEVKTVLYSIWYHDTRRSKLYYTASGSMIPGGQNRIIQHLVSWYQEVKTVLYSIWYHYTRRSKMYYTASGSMMPGGQNCIIQHLVAWYQEVKIYYTASGIITPVCGRTVHSPLSTCTPDGHLQVWRYQMLYNTVLTSWWLAQQCSKHVEAHNKLIIKQ